MEKIRISSSLKSFVLLDKITRVDQKYICGNRYFSDGPYYTCIEAIAQLGAYHVRFITKFTRHAFLLKIDCMTLKDIGKETASLNGKFNFSASLTDKSKSAFVYNVCARKNKMLFCEGKFLFASIDYNYKFDKNILKDHYQKVFLCLMNDSKTA